jgi:hypothetical protein
MTDVHSCNPWCERPECVKARQLEFLNNEAEFWRMKYLKAKEEPEGKSYTDNEAYTALCIWEFVIKPDPHTLPEYWLDLFSNDGTCTARENALSLAHIVDLAWEFASKTWGYDAEFDWDFVPSLLCEAKSFDELTNNFREIVSRMLAPTHKWHDISSDSDL